MTWLKRRPKPPEPQIFMAGWACEDEHVWGYDSDGVCPACGQELKPAVVKGYRGYWPDARSFARWRNE